MTVKPLTDTAHYNHQGLLKYYPQQLFCSEFCIRNHLILPEDQMHILLSEKKNYVIHHIPSLLWLPGNCMLCTSVQFSLAQFSHSVVSDSP